MFNFADFKELKANAVNTTDNGHAFREVTHAEVKDAFIGETIQYMSTYSLKEDATTPQQVSHKLAQLAENDCDGAVDLGQMIQGKILSLAERLQEARSKSNDVGVANAQDAAQGVLTFIKRLQNGVGRNSYYRWLEACKAESSKADMATKSTYDGFQYVNIDPIMIAEVIDELYDELTVAYGYCLGLCSDYIVGKMSTFPFAAIPDGSGSFTEYPDRQSLFNALADKKAASSSVAKEALSLI
jgi:hypothetical protein